MSTHGSIPMSGDGLVVDYLDLADQLKRALAVYSEGGGQDDPTFDTAQAIAAVLEKYSIACDLMRGCNCEHTSRRGRSSLLTVLAREPPNTNRIPSRHLGTGNHLVDAHARAWRRTGNRPVIAIRA